MLSVEISTHLQACRPHPQGPPLIYLPDLEAVERFNARLGHGTNGLGGNSGPMVDRSSD
jgi:hypothetical protein